MHNPISKEAVLSYLSDHPWQTTVQVFDQVESTNVLAKQLASAGAPSGTVLIAESQTGGKGRMGRSFLSPSGMGIYLSVILRPNASANQLMHLTCAVAESMCTAVEEATDIRPQIKWTNDLVYEGKKLGGILTELSFVPGTQLVDYAIIGVGINCGQQKADFDPSIRPIACSVNMIAGEPIDRNLLCARMIDCLSWMDRYLMEKKHGIMESYRCDCITLGSPISVVRGDEVRHGTALDLDNDGGLLVAYEDGKIETVNSGEVSVRGMYGYV